MYKSLALILLLFSSLAQSSELIVWNVGQGQWVTEVQKDDCFHYDLGGEKKPTQRALQMCAEKMNYIHLSHWDWDHISFVHSFASQVRRVCLIKPQASTSSRKKISLIQGIPICSVADLKSWHVATTLIYHGAATKISNEQSEVIYSRNFKTVIPGDSPKNQERIWADNVPLSNRGLVLGHHGSRTSTSMELLQHLQNLKWAVASARKDRYGHPHQEVIERLKKEKVPLLKTEDWGHLHFMNSD